MDGTAAKILVVDDEWVTRLQVIEMLTELGYQVAGKAESGQQGVEKALDLSPDLILMDIIMPGGMNGIEAAKRIKAESDIPIIFISGFGDPEYVEKAKEVEPFGYIMKPFDGEEIRASVEIALHKRKIETALRRSEERYRHFVEGTDDMIVQVEKSGVFTFANHAVHKFLGMTSKELLGTSVQNFVYPPDREKTAKSSIGFKGVKSSGTIFENRMINPATGEIHHINWTINPQYDDQGRVLGFNAIGKDLTNQKKILEAESNARELKSLGILAGGIAHDYNNLMAAVVTNIGIAKMNLKPESSGYRRLAKAEELCVRTKVLSAQLLSLAERVEPEKKARSMENILKDSVGSSIKETDVNCRFSIPDDIAPVAIDVGQMKTAIGGIVENAGESMPGGGVIHVSCENIELGDKDALTVKEGNYVKISIKDHGKGMPQGILEKIFDPYFSTKAVGTQKGMGLGLAISESIVKNHFGFIKAESRLGECSTLSIYLPALEE